MAKGDILLKVLEKLEEAAVTSFDLFDAFTSAGYGASMGKINYELSKINERRAGRTGKAELKQRYFNLLSKLKKDGLVKTGEKNNSRTFSLTRKGRKKLNDLKLRHDRQLPHPSQYERQKGGVLIVVFDVPEKERRKRDWLRSVLKNLGLEMVQKSVWIGRVKIPEKLLEDMEKMGIIEFVEIFEVTKSGSLKQIG